MKGGRYEAQAFIQVNTPAISFNDWIALGPPGTVEEAKAAIARFQTAHPDNKDVKTRIVPKD